MKKKICKRCKAIVEGTSCPDPQCGGVQSGQLAQSYKGRMHILDALKSDVAKKIGVKYKGEYAIKVS